MISIGTSGWNYKHWKGIFYPEDLPASRWLQFFKDKFSTVEINNSFYRLPGKKTFENWKNSVPAGFIFAVKANRYLTHMKKLSEPEEPLRKMLDNIAGLEDKLGPVLFQFPPYWPVDTIRLKAFLEILPRDIRFVFEFRNHSWWKEEVFELLNRYNVAYCIYEATGIVTPKVITTDFVYIRFHNPENPQSAHFEYEALASWAEDMTLWASEGKNVYCYFNNDQSGYALEDGFLLKYLVEDRKIKRIGDFRDRLL